MEGRKQRSRVEGLRRRENEMQEGRGDGEVSKKWLKSEEGKWGRADAYSNTLLLRGEGDSGWHLRIQYMLRRGYVGGSC